MERKDPVTGRSATGDRIEGNWRQLKGKLKEKWGELTDDDLDRMAGRREQLIGYLQERSGQGRADVERQLDDLSRDAEYRF